MLYNALAIEIHQNNINKGFWDTLPDDPTKADISKRNVGEILALIHSEVSEAFEGYILKLYDDKLTDYKAEVVELADVVIRILDTLVAYGITDIDERLATYLPDGSSQDYFYIDLNFIHLSISKALEAHRKGKDWLVHLIDALAAIKFLEENNDFPLPVSRATVDKHIYNKGRPFKHDKAY